MTCLMRVSAAACLTFLAKLGLLAFAAPAALAEQRSFDFSAVSFDAAQQDRQQVTSLGQCTDLCPEDWAYQALKNLVERYGCVAGYPNGTFQGNQPISRYEGAALLNACLDRISEMTDEVKRLLSELEKELALLRGRVDAPEARSGELEATPFSTTTKLMGVTAMVLKTASGPNKAISSAVQVLDPPADQPFQATAALHEFFFKTINPETGRPFLAPELTLPTVIGREGESLRILQNGLQTVGADQGKRIHNIMACTVCSCYPQTLLGVQPTWYKSQQYRSRVMSSPLGVLDAFMHDLIAGDHQKLAFYKSCRD